MVRKTFPKSILRPLYTSLLASTRAARSALALLYLRHSLAPSSKLVRRHGAFLARQISSGEPPGVDVVPRGVPPRRFGMLQLPLAPSRLARFLAPPSRPRLDSQETFQTLQISKREGK